jgi:hypothetical protein
MCISLGLVQVQTEGNLQRQNESCECLYISEARHNIEQLKVLRKKTNRDATPGTHSLLKYMFSLLCVFLILNKYQICWCTSEQNNKVEESNVSH